MKGSFKTVLNVRALPIVAAIRTYILKSIELFENSADFMGARQEKAAKTPARVKAALG